MTLLDTFFISFKTDAKGTKEEIAALDKQISELAAKGSKRDEKEIKQLAELRKQRQDYTRDLKDQTREVDRLGDSLGKIFEGAAGALGAYTAFNAIKSGVLDVTNFNSALNITAQRTGETTQKLREFDAIFQSAGSQRGTGLQLFSSIFEAQAGSGLSTSNPGALLGQLRSAALFSTEGLSGTGRASRIEQNFQRLGISDPAAKALISGPIADFNAAIAEAAKNAQLSTDEAKKAREFEKAQAHTQTALQTAYTKIADDVLPSLTAGLQNLTGLINRISGVPGAATAVAGGGILASLIGGKWLSGRFLSLLGGGGGAAAAEGGGLLAGGTALSAVLATAALAYFHQDVADGILSAKDYLSGGGPGSKYKTGSGATNKQESLDFWISQGYTPAQAAGIVANEQSESGFDPAARGDGGTAFGSFQWHQARRRKIYQATGIDVASASHADQLRAANWELNDSGLAAQLKQAASARDAGALFSSQFERPANGAIEAIRRGQLATSIAGQSSLNTTGGNTNNAGDSSFSLKIDELNVHTQATDATGISQGIGSALTNEFRNAFSNIDNGVAG